jgi:hypothetical protein
MITIHDAMLRLHGVVGFVAMAAFWTAALTPKGGLAHRKAGWAYVAAMIVVLVTASVIAVMLAIVPQRLRDFTGVPAAEVTGMIARLRGIAAFFGALALLTLTAGWNGLRALWARRKPRPWHKRAAMGLFILDVAVSPALVALGVRDGEPLLILFAGFCLMAGAGGLRSLRRPSPDPSDWLFQHLGNMIATGIAAHTAFFAVGAVRWIPDLYSRSPALYLVPWIMPALMGSVAMVVLKRHYRGRAIVLALPARPTIGGEPQRPNPEHQETKHD